MPTPDAQAGQYIVANRFEVLGRYSENLIYARDRSKRCDRDFQTIVLIKSTSLLKKDCLLREVEVYKALGSCPGFPALEWFGEWDSAFCICVSYKGCNLERLRFNLPEIFDVQTVAIFAIEMIDRIRHLHTTGFIHGDIKPDNFTLGPEAYGQPGKRGVPIVNLIDFDSAFRVGEKWNAVLPRALNPAFASIRALLGHPPSKVDDLESLAYTLLFLLLGDKVPWISGLHSCLLMGKDGERRMASIKSDIVSEIFCRDLPPVYARFLRYTRELDARAQPHYDYFIQEFWMACAFR